MTTKLLVVVFMSIATKGETLETTPPPHSYMQLRSQAAIPRFQIPETLPENSQPGISENLLRIKEPSSETTPKIGKVNRERFDLRYRSGQFGFRALTFTFRWGTLIEHLRTKH